MNPISSIFGTVRVCIADLFPDFPVFFDAVDCGTRPDDCSQWLRVKLELEGAEDLCLGGRGKQKWRGKAYIRAHDMIGMGESGALALLDRFKVLIGQTKGNVCFSAPWLEGPGRIVDSNTSRQLGADRQVPEWAHDLCLPFEADLDLGSEALQLAGLIGADDCLEDIHNRARTLAQAGLFGLGLETHYANAPALDLDTCGPWADVDVLLGRPLEHCLGSARRQYPGRLMIAVHIPAMGVGDSALLGYLDQLVNRLSYASLGSFALGPPNLTRGYRDGGYWRVLIQWPFLGVLRAG